MDFTKIKLSEKKGIELAWRERRGEDEIEHHLTSHDLPRPEFAIAMLRLASYVEAICELGDWAGELRPIGLSLSRSAEGARGIVITCLRKVEIVPAPVVLNTPHVPEELWPVGLAVALRTVECEAEMYAHGNRAQAEMFGAAADRTDATAGVGA